MKKIKLACVIDDDPIYVYGTKRQMGIVGFCEDLLVLENGEVAIQELKSRVEKHEPLPEVILLDINMPIMDGWQFLDEFIQLPLYSRQPLIYVVSSSVDQQDIDKANAYSQVTSYLSKPLKAEDLQNIMQQV